MRATLRIGLPPRSSCLERNRSPHKKKGGLRSCLSLTGFSFASSAGHHNGERKQFVAWRLRPSCSSQNTQRTFSRRDPLGAPHAGFACGFFCLPQAVRAFSSDTTLLAARGLQPLTNLNPSRSFAPTASSYFCTRHKLANATSPWCGIFDTAFAVKLSTQAQES
jgi:hypothetical protein